MTDISDLNKEDLLRARNSLQVMINKLSARRDQLYPGTISQDAFMALGGIEQDLINIRSRLSLIIIDDILVEIDIPKQRINDATLVINDRIEKLNEINEALMFLGNVINLFSGIVGGISTGTIPDLQALLAPFFTPPNPA